MPNRTKETLEIIGVIGLPPVPPELAAKLRRKQGSGESEHGYYVRDPFAERPLFVPLKTILADDARTQRILDHYRQRAGKLFRACYAHGWKSSTDGIEAAYFANLLTAALNCKEGLPTMAGWPFPIQVGNQFADHVAEQIHKSLAKFICHRCGGAFGELRDSRHYHPGNPTRADAKYCSPACKQAAYRGRHVTPIAITETATNPESQSSGQRLPDER